MTAGLERQLRRLILALLAFGLTAVTGELFALGHYEEVQQLVPIFALSVSLAVVAWHAISGSAVSVSALRVLMAVLVLVGLIGVFLHVRGSLEFQLEANPDLSGWPLVHKILHAKAPPALAPGVMVQLGLLGLIYAYRHPGRQEP
jgi:hypothetical protein